jgi:hypothetical protein
VTPPVDLDDEGTTEIPAEPAFEFFYRGQIVRYAAGSQSGILRTGSGREVAFELEHVVVLGALVAGPGRYALAAGQEVGFDLGWTSRGLRVTKLFPLP